MVTTKKRKPPQLKIGDKVNWRGAWGSEKTKPAKVTGLIKTTRKRSKDGKDVNSVSWGRKEYFIADLDNGHWAYGTQLTKYRKPRKK